MRKLFTMLLLTGIQQVTCAQDSLKVSYSQESDTLVKQRFIDRYENVFMTKVPTLQMFKLSAVGSEVQGIGFNFAYEYKVFPSLSLEASLYTQLNRFHGSIANELLHFNWRGVNVWANAKARWYPNMAKRIASGLSANNFSGTYVGLSYEQSLYLHDSYSNKNTERIGLLYGFQSRFFNRGFIDFAVGLYQKDAGQFNGFQPSSASLSFRNFVLGTHVNLGLAFGDWKKTTASPVCDVIFCDELVQDQLKIQLPDILVGLRQQIVRSEVAYERKIGRSPFSTQVWLGMSLYNQDIPHSFDESYLSLGGNLELRYYFLEKFLARRGKGGSNFSGPYAGVRAGYSRSTMKTNNHFQPEFDLDARYRTISGALLLGYQQRLFKRIYIDGSLFYQKGYPSGYSIIGASKPFFSSKMTLGFTF